MSGTNAILTQEEQRLDDKIRRNLGTEFLSAIEDPATIELTLNADGNLWQEKFGSFPTIIGKISPAHALAAIQAVATSQHRTITSQSPILEGELSLDGSRFSAMIPPIVSAPTISVRKKSSMVFTLDDYVAHNILSERQREVLISAIKSHKNILVVGGTSSGKTTLTNALIHAISILFPEERLIIMEDTKEIQCLSLNHVQITATREVPLTKILQTSLRHRPDRILVGEVRGPEALDLLMAWNTGHEGGIATLHANKGIQAGLDRLYSLISMAANPPRDIKPLIGEAVHLIVYIAKTSEGRKVQDIFEVNGFEKGEFKISKL